MSLSRHLFRRSYATKYIGKVVTSTSDGRFSAVEVSVPTTPLSDVRGYLLPRRDLICKAAQILQSKSAASSPDPFLDLSEFLQTLSIPLTPSEASEILKSLKSPTLALEFFHFCSSKISNFRHDAFTFNRILLILSNSSLPDRIGKLKEIVELMERAGRSGNISTVNILIGAFDGADGVEKCLDMVKKWDLKLTRYTYKCLLQAYLRGNHLDKAMEVYTEMRRKGWKLDIFSYNMLLHALAIEEKNLARLSRLSRCLKT